MSSIHLSPNEGRNIHVGELSLLTSGGRRGHDAPRAAVGGGACGPRGRRRALRRRCVIGITLRCAAPCDIDAAPTVTRPVERPRPTSISRSKPVAMTVTRISPCIAGSFTAPKMISASSPTASCTISLICVTSPNVRSCPPVMFSRTPVEPATDTLSSSGTRDGLLRGLHGAVLATADAGAHERRAAILHHRAHVGEIDVHESGLRDKREMPWSRAAAPHPPSSGHPEMECLFRQPPVVARWERRSWCRRAGGVP